MTRLALEPVQALTDLGFTGLEAEVYAHLLRESPATGYRVAQAIGKPVANTYKAIESLQSKGAILVDEGENRQCRAVPADELLGRLERAFEKKRARAQDALSKIATSGGDDRVYQLTSRDQILERCRAMLARAEVVALVDSFPGPLEELKTSIEDCARRGITLGVKGYRPMALENVELLVDPSGERTIATWPGQWVNLVVDGREHLISFLSNDGAHVHQAIWSGSAYLSWVYHSALAAEITMTTVLAELGQSGSLERIRSRAEAYTRYFSRREPGFRELMERFGDRK